MQPEPCQQIELCAKPNRMFGHTLEAILEHFEGFDPAQAQIISVRHDQEKNYQILSDSKGLSFFFKPKSSVGGLIPLTFNYLAEHFSCQTHLPVKYVQWKGEYGIACPYLEQNQDNLDKKIKKFFELPLEEVAKLHLCRYLSGSHDDNMENYLLFRDQLYSIDHEDEYMQLGFYGDWPYVCVHKTIEEKDITEFFQASPQTTSAEDLADQVIQIGQKRKSVWQGSQNDVLRRLQHWCGPYKIIKTSNALWIQRRYRGRSFFNNVYLNHNLLAKVRDISFEKLALSFEQIPHLKKEAGELFIKGLCAKQEHLLRTINKQENLVVV